MNNQHRHVPPLLSLVLGILLAIGMVFNFIGFSLWLTKQNELSTENESLLGSNQSLTPVSYVIIIPSTTATKTPIHSTATTTHAPLPTHTLILETVSPTSSSTPLPTSTVTLLVYLPTAEPTIFPATSTPEIKSSDVTHDTNGEQENRFVISTLGIDSPIMIAPIVNQTWDVNHLGQNIGYLERTAMVGSGGNTVLAGHVTLDSYGVPGPFANLFEIQSGDEAIIYKNGKAYVYTIDITHTVKPSDIQFTYPSSLSKLTLITCLNYDINSKRYLDRLVVVGYLRDEKKIRE
ncbi:MAG: hypothetical protein B6242_01590 [Anaerolineaceae bacterium 4572_78]|nr:MAG: hypothetical protein B6242_01590 [Anaerolineaceae bacterium 4572_78]